MIRIETATKASAITITVDGQLSGDNVGALETCVHQALEEAKPVRLFLRDVSSIDACSRAQLCSLVADGVNLSASGIYSSYVVAGIIREQRKRHGKGSPASEDRHLTRQSMRHPIGISSGCPDTRPERGF